MHRRAHIDRCLGRVADTGPLPDQLSPDGLRKPMDRARGARNDEGKSTPLGSPMAIRPNPLIHREGSYDRSKAINRLLNTRETVVDCRELAIFSIGGRIRRFQEPLHFIVQIVQLLFDSHFISMELA